MLLGGRAGAQRAGMAGGGVVAVGHVGRIYMAMLGTGCTWHETMTETKNDKNLKNERREEEYYYIKRRDRR